MASISRRASQDVRVDDRFLIALAKNGDRRAHDQIVRRYYGFVRMKASSYFLVGGDHDDLIQEGLVGLYKAVRDFRPDRESSFRNFAELCITRQIITAVKTSTRNKHKPLNGYVSFSRTAASSIDNEPTLEEILPGPATLDPATRAVSSEELAALVGCLSSKLSDLESRALALYPRRPLLRGDRRARRLPAEGDRQRAAAREAQGADAPARARGHAHGLTGRAARAAARICTYREPAFGRHADLAGFPHEGPSRIDSWTALRRLRAWCGAACACCRRHPRTAEGPPRHLPERPLARGCV